MKRNVFPLLVVFILLSVGSCGNYPCGKGDLDYGFIGFSDQEVDTIILRRFVKNASFSRLVDTLMLDERYRRSQDTLKWTSAVGNRFLESDYDYELYFPLAGKLIRITDIHEEQRNNDHIFSCNKDYCVNFITGYKLNGQTDVPVHNSFTYFSK